MLRSSLIAAGSVILCTAAAAQSVSTDLHRVQSTIQNGGLYHVATGTWTRNVPTGVNLGPDVVYNNTANSSFYTTLGIGAEVDSFETVDAARLPGPGDGGTANRTLYNVNCVDFGYCIENNTANGLEMGLNIYESYIPCDDPANSTASASFLITGLPGATAANIANGYATCWLVGIDLSGGNEVCMDANGDGAYDADLDFDSFGLGWEFDPGGAGGYVGAGFGVGMLLSGDRNWTAQAAGELMPAGSAGGGGGDTYYGPAETCVPGAGGRNSSGFDNQDFMFIGFGPSNPNGPGCYWFGGYDYNQQCNADGGFQGANPHAGFYFVLQADTTNNCSDGLDRFCATVANSTGVPTDLDGGFGSGVGSDLHLECTDGPAGDPGYFLVGDTATAGVMVSNGLLCLVGGGATVARLNIAGGPMNSIGIFDGAGVLQNVVGTATSTGGSGYDFPNTLPIFGAVNSGSTWHIQVWHRDTPAGAGTSNFSNGVSVMFP